MKAFEALKHIDIIGKEIQFKIENSEKYKTGFGGVITILLAILSLTALWFFGNDIIYRINPSFIQKTMTYNTSDFIPLNRSNFFFAIRFTDYFGNLVSDPRIIVPTFRYEWYEMNTTTNVLGMQMLVDVELSYCNTSHIDYDILVANRLETYYCANLENFTIGGDWNGYKLGIMYFNAYKCNSEIAEQKNITCATEEEIIENYNGLLYQEFISWNSLLDPTNFTNPIALNLEYKFDVIDLNLRKENKYFYSVAELYTDDGIMFENKFKTSFLVLDSITIDIGKIQEDKMMETNINFTKKKVINYRYYQKVQDIAATVGGFFSLFFYIFRAIYYFYIEIHLQNRYFDELLKFQVDQDFLSKEEKLVENDKKPNLHSSNIKISKQDNWEEKLDNQKRNNDDSIELNNLNTSFRRSNNILTIIPFTKTVEKGRTLTTKGNNNLNRINAYIDNSEETLQVGTLIGLQNPRRKKSERLEKMIKSINKKREPLNLTYIDLFLYKYCFCASKYSHSDIKNQLIFLGEYVINKKIDTLRILQNFDQFRLIKKMLLNEDQCFMINNLGRSIVKNTDIAPKKDFTKLVEDKKQRKLQSLKFYWSEKKEKNLLDEIDTLLFSVMDEDIKEELEPTTLTNIDKQ